MPPSTATGEWWLPETPERKVHGTLRIDARGRSELELSGTLRSFLAAGETTVKPDTGETITEFSEESLARSGVYSRIVGLADGESFTLEDCIQTGQRNNFFGGGPSSERIISNQVLRGIEFEAGEAVEFCEADTTLQWLPYWVRSSGLEETLTFETDDSGRIVGHRAAEIRVKMLPSEACLAPDGAHLQLQHCYRLAGDQVVERKLTQNFMFRLAASGKVPLTDLTARLGDLQALVSAGVGRIAAFESVAFKHPDVSREVGGKTHLLPVEYYVQWQAQPIADPPSLGPHDMFFTLPDLGGMPGVEKWLWAVEKHRSALGRVLASRYSTTMFVTDRLLNCAASLEAYDRDKHGDEKVYRSRLERCAAYAGEPFGRLMGRVATWTQAMKDARNDVAHHNSQVKAASSTTSFLAQSAYFLFVLCLLRDSGAPPAVFESIADHREYRWLKRSFVEIL